MRLRISCSVVQGFVLFCIPAPVHAGDPFLTKLDLFHQNDAGYATYRIPGIVVTTKGTILAYCEGRKDGTGDWAEIDVQLRRSTDGGKTFEPARKIAHLGPRVPRSSI